ncbi:hypothetical protein [Geobacter sp. SVR]|uniref:hypothetical protein n=1 Tax=Geobacter sp. SVR TaxID=2495594 RepID=UPI00143EF783|nr:hypothetical protein [Geobacter sp. SVR]BCS55170.1 hypothetical protein GSVR_34780 [Geobacter sp. SVR]GCF85351.1 hypothetical protein GSbR_19510 [Geobacter sp. SVR]
MTPETREKLDRKLREHGLTVLLSRDYDQILHQLARLSEFKCLIECCETAPVLAAVKCVDRIQAQRDGHGDAPAALAVLDIPAIQSALNRALYGLHAKGRRVNLERLPAAITAFLGILGD